MNKKISPLQPAGRAIAATLALFATPVLAQDVTVTTSSETVVSPAPVTPAPVVIATQPAEVADAAPQLTVTTADPVQADPVSEPVTADTAAPAATPRVATPARATAISTPRIAPADPSPVSTAEFDSATAAADVPVVANADTADGAAALAAAQSVTDTPVSNADNAEASNTSLVILGGGLALALGLGGFLMAGTSRRRRAARAGAVVAPRETVLEPRTEPVRQAPTIAPVAAAAPAFAISASNPAPSYASKWNNDGYVNASPAAGVAGRAVPNTPEGRRALIDRLVRARPDRTNPFTSYAARRRRARLIVQSLQQKLAEQPNLDFRRFYDSFGQRKAAMA